MTSNEKISSAALSESDAIAFWDKELKALDDRLRARNMSMTLRHQHSLI
jgi:hypothetical protein